MIKATFGFLALALGGALAFGCGGDDSGGSTPTKSEFISICKRFCEKYADCSGQDSSGCTNLCNSQADAAYKDDKPAEDCNYNKVKAKINECLKVECSELESCSNEVSDICPALGDDGSTGSGGATGAGGSSGDGGSSGSTGTGGKTSGTGGKASGTGGATTGGGDCSACDKAAVCCKGAAEASGDDPSDCDAVSTQCPSIPAAQKSQFIQACQQIIDLSAGSGLCD